MAQNVIFASLAIAFGMAAACVADIVTGFPFAGQTTMDITFIVASAVVAWMGFGCLRGMRKR